MVLISRLDNGSGGAVPPRFVPSIAILAILTIFTTLPAVPCAAQAASADPAGQGREAEVFDATRDDGSLVARFLRMSLVSDSEEKSGDATLLKSPDGLLMLIDGGAPECGPQVEAYIEALGAKRLDAVVASHPHVDHIGGLTHILQRYPVGTVYMSRLEYPTRVYADFMAAVKKSGADVVYLEAGSSFRFGADVAVEVYNPEPDIRYYDGYPANSTQFVNNKSLVMRLSYGDSSILFTGDVYTSLELDLIGAWGERLKAYVLKVGHHGSDTSSSKSWIRAVSPSVAVMMHDAIASLKVYKNYTKAGTATYITCIDGSVRVSLDGEGGIAVTTEYDRCPGALE